MVPCGVDNHLCRVANAPGALGAHARLVQAFPGLIDDVLDAGKRMLEIQK